MFYSFCTPKDVKTDGNYWKKFEGQLQMYPEEQQLETKERQKGKIKHEVETQVQVLANRVHNSSKLLRSLLV